MGEKVLIIGASGQLGRGLTKVYRKSKGEVHLQLTYNSTPVEGGVRIDVTDPTLLEDFILKHRPDVIINASAYTDVDGCEVNKNFAFLINSEAVRHMIRASRVVGAYFVHVSTDYVFDGEKGLYKEEDTPSPINYYGLSKLLGEAYALSYDDSLVVRTSGVFGYKANFPSLVLKNLKEGKEVYAWKDYFYSPIHADLLGEAIARLTEMRKTGIIHVGGERVSRFELALKVAEKIGVDKGLVKPSTPQNTKAKRPKDSSLDVGKAKALLSFDFFSSESNIKALLGEGK